MLVSKLQLRQERPISSKTFSKPTAKKHEEEETVNPIVKVLVKDRQMFDVCDYSMTKGFYVSSIEKCGVEDCMKRGKWPGKILENLKPMLLCETHAKMWRKEIAVSREEVCHSCGEKGSTLLVKCNFERCNRAYHVRIPCLKEFSTIALGREFRDGFQDLLLVSCLTEEFLAKNTPPSSDLWDIVWFCCFHAPEKQEEKE